MSTRQQQQTKYWPTDKAIAVLDGTPPPPPQWRNGDVVAIGDHTLLRVMGLWFCTCSKHDHRDREINVDWRNGDVVHLVRDGKPVTP